MLTSSTTTGRDDLYRWQVDALVSWLRCGRRGVIEAVTGSGKTDVAITAAADAGAPVRPGARAIPRWMEQWHERLTRALPGRRIGRLGDSGRDDPSMCDVPSRRSTPAAIQAGPAG
jgi:superfamily II DNA or RNA helicase